MNNIICPKCKRINSCIEYKQEEKYIIMACMCGNTFNVEKSKEEIKRYNTINKFITDIFKSLNVKK
jgi:lysyl-tRNA synthetase class I